MAGDIELDGDEVKVTGSVLKLTVTDVTLDNETRRGPSNPDKPRRALVHAQNDSLVLNWDNDYPNGVTINGPVKFPGSIEVNEAHFKRVMAIDAQDGSFMRLKVGGGFKKTHEAAKGIRTPMPSLDVYDELTALRDRVAALEAAITALQGR